MFLEQQISILEWFVKDHVTLKTGVMMLKIQLCLSGINYIFKIHSNRRLLIIYHNFYCIFDNKCSLGAHKREKKSCFDEFFVWPVLSQVIRKILDVSRFLVTEIFNPWGLIHHRRPDVWWCKDSVPCVLNPIRLISANQWHILAGWVYYRIQEIWVTSGPLSMDRFNGSRSEKDVMVLLFDWSLWACRCLMLRRANMHRSV